MAENAPVWYVEDYKDKALHAYQSKGNTLKNTTTPPTKIVGKQMTFPIAEIMDAEEDVQRGDEAVPQNPDDGNVVVTTKKSRAFTEVFEDDLDQMNVDERQVNAERSGYALGRTHDKTIVNAVRAGTNEVGDFATPITVDLLLQGANALQDRDVMWDGNVFCAVDSVSWNRLISYPIINKSDYVGPDLPMVKGSLARSWNGVHIFQLPNKTLQVSGTEATCLMWHRSAVGFGYVRQLMASVQWDNRKDCWTHNMRMRIGSKILLDEGVQRLKVKHLASDINLAASAT